MPLERVFIDTNILVSAVACDRNERKLLHMAAEGEIRAILSDFVLREADRVIRAKFPSKWQWFQWEMAFLRFELIADLPPSAISQAAALVRDPGDAEVLAAILVSKPDVALTGDKDLLTEEVRAIAPTCRCADYLDRRSETND